MPQLLEPQSTPTLSQVHLDPQRTKDSATAVLAAYADFDNKKVNIPSGYRCITHFTGWDQIFYVTGREELFGLVLQSIADPETYMVAFRGTDSLLDGYEDIWANTVSFVPQQNDGHFPSDVKVASGFNSVYTAKGGSMVTSMQTQLFDILDGQSPAPRKVLICGHSLGSSLANLFALDVAVSRPKIDVVNTTFASPRTGTAKWETTYNDVYNLEGTTFRIANYWDIIPSLPPRTLLDYRHVGEQFLVSFYVLNAWYPHYYSRHSMLNYQTVVDNAVDANPQVWEGQFPDAAVSGLCMVSTKPPSATVPDWSELIAATEQRSLEAS